MLHIVSIIVKKGYIEETANHHFQQEAHNKRHTTRGTQQEARWLNPTAPQHY